MKGDIFCEYLRYVRDYEPTGRRIFLILDVHPSHRTDAVKATAAQLDIELIYIPPGATDDLQPLDRKVFGALKGEARRIFREWATENPELTVKRIIAAHTMCVAWDQLSQATIESAWNIYEADNGVWVDV
jgi:hypothetical protein